MHWVIMQAVMKEKLGLVNMFYITTVQYIARVQVNLWYDGELAREVTLSHCATGRTLIHAGWMEFSAAQHSNFISFFPHFCS